MAVPQSTTLFSAFGQMLSTTYNQHRSETSDAISNHNALYRRLTKKGRTRVETGGMHIVEPIAYQGTGTYQRYSRFQKLNIGARDMITSAIFQWRQSAVAIALAGSDMRRNQGKSAAVRLVTTVITAARNDYANNLSNDFYSDGTASEQIGGLQAMIPDGGAGTFAGIDSSLAANAFWKAPVQSAANPLQGSGAIVPSATTIQSLMLPLYLKLTVGGSQPDLIVFSDDYYTFYEASLTGLKMYTSDEQAQGSFISLKYRNADVFNDTGGGCPAAHGYFINTDHVDFVALSGANMDLTEDLKPIDQDAIGKFILLEGNLTCNNRKRLGVMKA